MLTKVFFSQNKKNNLFETERIFPLYNKVEMQILEIDNSYHNPAHFCQFYPNSAYSCHVDPDLVHFCQLIQFLLNFVKLIRIQQIFVRLIQILRSLVKMRVGDYIAFH